MKVRLTGCGFRYHTEVFEIHTQAAGRAAPILRYTEKNSRS